MPKRFESSTKLRKAHDHARWPQASGFAARAGLHPFRHPLATVLIIEEQVDPKTAQGILRHATVRHHNGYLHARAGRRKAEGSGEIRGAVGAVKSEVFYEALIFASSAITLRVRHLVRQTLTALFAFFRKWTPT